MRRHLTALPLPLPLLLSLLVLPFCSLPAAGQAQKVKICALPRVTAPKPTYYFEVSDACSASKSASINDLIFGPAGAGHSPGFVPDPPSSASPVLVLLSNATWGAPPAAAPAGHHTTHEPGGTDAMAVDAAAGTGSLRTLGTGATQAAAGNDSRFTDARLTAYPTGGTFPGDEQIVANIKADDGQGLRLSLESPSGLLGWSAIIGIDDATTAKPGVVTLATPSSDVTAGHVVQASDARLSNSVAQGRTGTTSLAAHGVVIGNGTSAVTVTSAGTAGQVLTSNGASSDPTFQAAPGGLSPIRKSASTNRNNTATQSLDPHLVATLTSGHTYDFTIRAHASDGTFTATGGIQVSLGGTVTVNNVVAQITIYQNDLLSIGAAETVVSLGTTASAAASVDLYIEIEGSIEVNTGGTFGLSWAQQSATTGNLTLLRGSLLKLTE